VRITVPPLERGITRDALGRLRGGFSTKINARTNADGLPIGVEITPGQAHDVIAYQALMHDIDCGDKGYDSETVRRDIEQRGGEAVIPSLASRKISMRSIRLFIAQSQWP
jgi:hypothetical protein